MKDCYRSFLCLILLLGACSQPEPTQNFPRQAPPKQTTSSARAPFSYIQQGDTLDWRTIETAVSASQKESVVTALAPFFAELNRENEEGPRLPRHAALHVLELNGDGQLDAVYNGPVGAEADVVWFFLNEHGRYRKLPQEWWGQIKRLTFRKRHLATLTLLDFGCCAQYIEFESTYAFDPYLQATPVLQRGTAAFTQRPTGSLLASPQAFRLSTDSIALRTAPIVDDTSTIMYDAVGKGNILLKFGKGAQGIAWASKVDSLGQPWRYVEMQPTSSTGYLMYSKEDFPTYTLGWMQAKDIH